MTLPLSAARVPLRGGCAMGLALAVVGSAGASVPVSGAISGSGVNADLSSTFQRDSNWKIVALPAGTSGLPSAPYDAYVPRTVNSAWVGANSGPNGSQGGYVVGGVTYHWIAPTSTVSGLFSGVTLGDPSTWYNWIAAQTFTVPRTDTYYLNFPAAVDNRLGFFINGAIDSATDPRKPNIVGGTQIGTTSAALGQFRQVSDNIGSIFLPAGTHTAYMVLTDTGSDTGVLIGPSLFSTDPIPAPASVSFMAMALIARCRRTRRA